MTEKVTRKEAIEQGLKVYWKAKPCPKGHVGWTRVSGGCVECQRNISNNYKKANKSELAEKRKEYLASDDGRRVRKEYTERVGRERNRCYIRLRRHNDHEYVEQSKITDRQWREENREVINERRRQKRNENKEYYLTKEREYQKLNRIKIRESRREYYRLYASRRRKNDTEYKLLTRMRDFNRRCVEAIKGVKNWRTKDVLGYTPYQLRIHIEGLWWEGMNWENYGEWHIDHVKSINSFIKEGVDDIRVINALTNLQPLWAFDNLSKGA